MRGREGSDGDVGRPPGRRVPKLDDSLGPQARAALQAHPRFAEAVGRVATGLTAYYAGNPLLNRLLSDRGRVVLGLFILYLDALPPEAGGGLTAARLVALCVQTRLCSRGRAKALLALMRWGGYVAPAAAKAADRRSKPLEPQERLRVLQAQRWRVIFGAAALVAPDAARLEARLDERAFRDALIIALGDAYCAGYRVVEHVPVLNDLVEYGGAMMVLLTLLASEDQGRLPVPIAELARRFHLSRAHVLKLLREAEARGLLKRGPRGAGTLTAAGRAAMGDFVASTFCLILGAARIADGVAFAN